MDPQSALLSLGLERKTAEQAASNPKLCQVLEAVLLEAGLDALGKDKEAAAVSKTVGKFVYAVTCKFPSGSLIHRPLMLRYIVSEGIKTQTQYDAGIKFLEKRGSESVEPKEFEEATGVGVEVTPEQIRASVTQVIAGARDELLRDRYLYNTGKLLAELRQVQPWANGKDVKTEFDAQILALLGPQTEEDKAAKVAAKKKKGGKAEDAAAATRARGSSDAASAPAAAAASAAHLSLPDAAENGETFAFFTAPADNNRVHTEVRFSTGEIMRICNTKEQLQRHLKATGGKVYTRFPPEPNGYLHIGHAKAMFIDFGFAEEAGGSCYLRYDDTNPSAEKKEYIDHIQEIVAWLGWKPFKITYSSDYFQELYELAVKLIKRGKAYVCHQTGDEIKEYREKRMDSPWRNRSVEENLRLFERMKKGLYAEGEATLRMKMDPRNDNFNMFDLIAYRIKYEAHPHAGDKWCIYPSYDYTHCVVDSLEDITHSLCTLEFETRRASYFWLLEELELYKPVVWEYSRLNVSNSITSKRKLNRLVTEKYVDGWDDPRLVTLAGLRRRGYTKEAINSFCRSTGVTRAMNLISLRVLEHFIRVDLHEHAPRTMVVPNPLKVVLTNLPDDFCQDIEAPRYPHDKSKSADTYTITLSKVCYIDASDFKTEDVKDYYGLAPNKTVMLRYGYPIKCTGYTTTRDPKTGKEVASELQCECDLTKSVKPKGVIQWVGGRPQDVTNIEVRLYETLFNNENPNEMDDWLADINPQSLQVIPSALGWTSALKGVRPMDRFQFERLGYFCCDTESTEERIRFNRTVTLKESVATSKIKQAAK